MILYHNLIFAPISLDVIGAIFVAVNGKRWGKNLQHRENSVILRFKI